MPIHDQTYRRYTGPRRQHGPIWWVIARTGIRTVLRDRRFFALLILAWAPFVVRAVQIYASATFPQASFLIATAGTFRDFMSQQGLFVFFVTIYVGAGLIADDRRANALQIYLSKPLTRVEYIVGKSAVLIVFLIGVTWLPAMLLLLFQVMFNGVDFVRDNLRLIPAITLLAAVETLVSALVMMAISSLSRSKRFVAVMYAGMIVFTAAIAGAVRAITGAASLAWLSPAESLAIVGDAIFRVPSAHVVPVGVAWASLAVVVAGAIVILERRVRGVEVVA